ncbi:TraB/GumN family protein [Sphingomonas soli]|uniref:TraB/GumN family protein n=1 Tax=Sphingomonas soli TaxID=266127 RepID=UPI00082A0706|nr:TraB/GumN family protein [Sphingomonas soli]
MLKKKLFALVASLAAFIAAPAWAQTKDADPAIWVVKDDDTTVYLFGTVHVLKPGLSWFDEAVKDAFDKSDEVVLEMVEPEPATMQGLIMKFGLNTTGVPFTDKLSEANRAKLATAAADLGMPVEATGAFEPWLVAVMASMAPLKKLGYEPESGAERTLSDAAKAANKPVIGLETAEQQLGFFDTLPNDLQISYLATTLQNYDKVGPMIEKMVAQWAAGDPVALGDTMNEGMRETPEIGKVLLSDRNARWAEWIEKRMEKPGTVFVAVGAGHLAGNDSVQSYLAKRRLTATRIAY